MRLQRIHIKNFKSIADVEIVSPNPFTVFVGPNGSGKSNIFEALEFIATDVPNKHRLFGGNEYLNHRTKVNDSKYHLQLDFEGGRENCIWKQGDYLDNNGDKECKIVEVSYIQSEEYFRKISQKFSRIFIGKQDLLKIVYSDDSKLNLAATNLEKVLKRILKDESKREELIDWLQLFIPEFKDLQISSSELSGTDTLIIYEKTTDKPFTKELISNGTYHILCLLSAVYQSDEPQFLCIEEPENGLNPYVIRKMVELFRNACEEKGHHIWLNTHSQTLVECLKPHEVVVVDKINGETKVTQPKDLNLHGLDMAEAWLSGILRGGTPW
ncbi:MAG: AAA family ATPase [Runella sp.]